MMSRLRERMGGDGGFTLVELLVAIVLLAIVVGLSTGSLINAIDQQSNVTQSTEAQSRNQVGVEMFTRLLRQATYPEQGNSTNSTIISVADNNKIVFTSRPSSTADASNTSINTTVRQYTFQLVGTNLQWGGADKTTCSSGVACTYGTPTLRTLVPGVRNSQGSTVCPANTGTGAVFRYSYFDTSGALVEATVPSGGLTTATTPALKDVVYVKIELFTQTQTGPRKPACVPVTDTVQLRNHP